MTSAKELNVAELATPVGMIHIAADDTYVRFVRFGAASAAIDSERTPLLRLALGQLAAWFDGRLIDFDLPLAPSLTPRGPAHRAAISAIAFGETRTYGMVARQIGSSARAVGQACRTNPFPIVVPCHRVLSQPGFKENYTGGEGVVTKSWLLHHEAVHATRRFNR